MKKLVVVSDNHGNQQILKTIKDVESDADYYIHCGDSEADLKEELDGYICVKGNRDNLHLDIPREYKMVIENVNVYITHGIGFRSFNYKAAMHEALKKNNCQLLLYGHTHTPIFMQDGSYTYINPGSICRPRNGSKCSYAIVTIDGSQIEYELKEVQK